MSRIVWLVCGLLVGAPLPAAALEIQFEGDVSDVVDPTGRLDGSIAVGTRLVGLYRVDPTPTGAPDEVASGRLTFQVGHYAFDVAQAPHAIVLIDDLAVGPASIDRWAPAAFVADQIDPALPAEPDGAGVSARIEFSDFGHQQITGLETAPFVVLDATPWSDTRLFFTSLVAAPGGESELGNLQWAVAIDTWRVVPEPASAALLALGLAVLARARRRRS